MMTFALKKTGFIITVFFFSLQGVANPSNQEFDIIISEIFSDPTPVIGLPEAEYVELYNRSSTSINLINWAFADATSVKAIETDFELSPGSYVILTKSSNLDLFTSFGEVIGLSSFPSLNNGGDDLRLIDSQGELIHQVNYNNNWHETDKDGGGWSLEIIDPDNTCEEENNWSSSTDPLGGTPGKINSIDSDNKDETEPSILSVNIISGNQIEVKFSENLPEESLIMTDKYVIEDDDDNPYNISNINICETNPNTCILIDLTEGIQEGIPLYLTASQLFDCAGNEISNEAFTFIKAVAIQPGNILINEILFDPPEDAEDFIEVYNNSNTSLDLNTLKIADLAVYDEPVQLNLVVNVLNPNEYVALTEDRQALIDYYNPPQEAKIVEVAQLPAFNKEEDLIVLLNETGEVIDSLTYHEDWHFSLLDDTDGVSLERIDIAKPSNFKTNWQSAAASVNYATPGYQNSQAFSIEPNNNMLIEVENTTVSPDSDGFEDFLIIKYKTGNPGWVGNIQIFDQRGRFVAHPTKNELLAESGLVKWDGLSENGERLALGIYIVYAEFFDLNGKVEKHKLPVIVAGKL